LAGIVMVWAGWVEARIWKIRRSGGEVRLTVGEPTGMSPLTMERKENQTRRNIRSTIQMAMEAEEREEMQDLAEMMGSNVDKR
jgi:hypothetical protein